MQKRLTTVGGLLIAGAAIYSFLADAARALRDAISVVVENPIGAALLVLGIGLVAWANRDGLRSMLGVGRSNGAWLRQIREWTHEKRGFELVESRSDRKSFRVVFRVPQSEKSSRTITVLREAGQENIVVAMGLNVSETHRTQLSQLPREQVLDLFDDVIIALSSRLLDTEIARDNKTGMPTQIGIVMGFPADSNLSELEFFYKLQSVVGATDTVNTLISKAARRAAGAAPAAAPVHTPAST